MRKLRPSLKLLLLWVPHPQGTESFSLSTCRASSSRAVTADVVVEEFVGNEIGPELQQQQPASVDLSAASDDEEGILAQLFGSAERRDSFFAGAFGRRVAYFPRRNRNERNNEPPPTTTHDGGSNRPIESPPITGIDLPSLYETNEWTALRKRGSHDMLDKSRMSYADLTEYISDGGSIVVPVTPDDYLFPTKLKVERALGVEEEHGTTINVYHSGPSAVALNVHYDSYPVFVLQLAGEKEWMIQDDAFGRPAREVSRWKNVTMTEGDTLYIPRGVLHAATTAEGFVTTTHATIGVL